MTDNKITIFDVAEKAGVSKGTVDRVLHDRGEVSKKSAEKVRKAVEELGYEPNLYASLLATKKNRTIACILPKYAPGEFWEKIHSGFNTGGEEVAALNIGINSFFYDQYDPDTFIQAYEEMIQSKPSGVVLQPLFKNDTAKLVARLSADGIPYVYVDTKLEDDNYFAYYGMPMYKSGYLCAALMTDRCSQEQMQDIVVVRIRRDRSMQSDPTLLRRSGFMDYMAENFPGCQVHNVFIDPNDPASINSTLEDFFLNGPESRHVVMFNSRVHLIADYLRTHPLEGRRVIGFDNLDANVEALKEGTIHYLIAQHAEEQSRRAVNTLADYILMHKVPANRDSYMHMDILTRLNVENY